MKPLSILIVLTVLISSSIAGSTGNLRNLLINNCLLYDLTGTCIGCILKYVLFGGECRAVSDQCKTWNILNGDCLSCYEGYYLLNGACFQG